MSHDSRPQDLHYFEERGGIWTRRGGTLHRNNEYDVLGFDILVRMQREHFWYRGRHRFLLRALEEHVPLLRRPADDLRLIDLGGGCGGWLNYLTTHCGARFKEIALADSSLRALELARSVTGEATNLFEVDLLDLGWGEAMGYRLPSRCARASSRSRDRPAAGPQVPDPERTAVRDGSRPHGLLVL